MAQTKQRGNRTGSATNFIVAKRPFFSALNLLLLVVVVGGVVGLNVGYRAVRNALSSAAVNVYPVDRSLNYVAPRELPLPGYLQPITDPLFGTLVTRVSDQTAMGVNLTTQQYIRNAYSKKAAWNSNGSRILLASIYPPALLDGNTYKYLGLINAPGNGTWSNTNPNIIYGVQYYSGNFVSLDITTNVTTIIKHFDGFKTFSLGDGEGNLSDDDRLAVFHGVDALGNNYAVLYNLVTKTSVIKNLGKVNTPNWMGMSHSGNYVVISWNAPGSDQYHGTNVWNLNLVYQRNVEYGVSHGDVAYDATGREVYVAGDDCKTASPVPCASAYASSMSAFPLNGNQSFSIINKANGYNPNGEHTSGRNIDRKGWVYVSDFGAPPPNISTYDGRDQVFALRVDPSRAPANPIVEVFAQSHHDIGMPYSSMPFAVPNRAGTKVLFGSEWNLGASAPAYAYVAGHQ